jgi:hypothetical protein
MPVLRVATADQETSGEFAGLFHPHGGKTGGVGDIDGGYHPGRGAVSENGLAAKRHKKRKMKRQNGRMGTKAFARRWTQINADKEKKSSSSASILATYYVVNVNLRAILDSLFAPFAPFRGYLFAFYPAVFSA